MAFYHRITTNNCEAYFLESLSNKIPLCSTSNFARRTFGATWMIEEVKQ